VVSVDRHRPPLTPRAHHLGHAEGTAIAVTLDALAMFRPRNNDVSPSPTTLTTPLPPKAPCNCPDDLLER
jgi:hypothetical protein